jgi:hypothetical protein
MTKSRNPLLCLLVVVGCALCWPSEIRAATFKLVRSHLLFMAGIIEYGDEIQFYEVTKNLPPDTYIALSSRGGNLYSGIKIGEHIRRLRFHTMVADGIADDGKLSRCSSVCALIWMAGTKKIMAQSALIGFHRAWSARTQAESVPANAVVGAYLARLGYSDSVVRFATEAAPDDMTWLDIDAIHALGIEVIVGNDDATSFRHYNPPPPNDSQRDVSLTQKAPPPGQSPTPTPGARLACVNTELLNLRAGPGMNYDVLMQLPAGT